MTDLRNTIAHILEHKQYLEGTNEATTQQYVVLPVLRTLGWNDANLASMEIIPEYQVESRRLITLYTSNRGRTPWCSLSANAGINQSKETKSKSAFTPIVEMSHLR